MLCIEFSNYEHALERDEFLKLPVGFCYKSGLNLNTTSSLELKNFPALNKFLYSLFAAYIIDDLYMQKSIYLT